MERSLDVFLQSIEEVKNFVSVVSSIDGDVTISNEHCAINAKSIMGILSLDLSKSFCIHVEKWKDGYAEVLKPFCFSK